VEERLLRKLIPILILTLACRQQESRTVSTTVFAGKDAPVVAAQPNAGVVAPARSEATLSATLASIRGLAKRVQNESIASEDVSQEFVDLESQVRNLEATETELRELLKVARVNSRKATDVLEVHEQLTIVRGQIEQARGRMRYLSQVTSMSAIALELTPDAIAQPVVEPGWQPLVVMKNASRALIALLQNLATGTIWFLIYVLPILGMLLLAITLLVKVARRGRTREA
jgi:hypothetical protein